MNKNKILGFVSSPYFAFLFLFFTLIVIASFAQMGNDEGMWSYIGRIWRENDMPPYINAIENKTPAVFELHYISNLLFGVNFLFIRFLGTLSILITSFLIFLLCRTEINYLCGIISMYIFGLVMAWELMDGAFIGQTETFMILFTVLAVFFIVRAKNKVKWQRFVFYGGLAMGTSLAFKQISLTSVFAILFFFLLFTSEKFFVRDKFNGVLLIFIGIITSTTVIFIPVLLSGVSFFDYVQGAWLILFNAGSSSSMDSHLDNFSRVWTETRIVIFYPFFLLLLFHRDLFKNRFFICLLIWLFFDFLGANLSGHYYGHQLKQVVPSFAILTGIAIAKSIGEIRGINYKLVLTIIAVILFFFPQFKNRSFVQGMKNMPENISSITRSELMGEWLKNHTDEHEPVYVLGHNSNQVLSYSERISSSKYFNLIFVTDARSRNELLAELKDNPPRYIVKDAHVQLFEYGLQNFIKNNYKVLPKKYGYALLKRNDTGWTTGSKE